MMNPVLVAIASYYFKAITIEHNIFTASVLLGIEDIRMSRNNIMLLQRAYKA